MDRAALFFCSNHDLKDIRRWGGERCGYKFTNLLNDDICPLAYRHEGELKQRKVFLDALIANTSCFLDGSIASIY